MLQERLSLPMHNHFHTHFHNLLSYKIVSSLRKMVGHIEKYIYHPQLHNSISYEIKCAISYVQHIRGLFFNLFSSCLYFFFFLAKIKVSLFRNSYFSLTGYDDLRNRSIALLTNWPCLGINLPCIIRQHHISVSKKMEVLALNIEIRLTKLFYFLTFSLMLM